MKVHREIKLLRYGELMARKARGDANQTELDEMEGIRKELGLSDEQIIEQVEHTVSKHH